MATHSSKSDKAGLSPEQSGLDYDALTILRKKHPAWRLLVADHAPLIASFLHTAFIASNTRTHPEPQLVSALEDFLFRIRETHPDAYPRRAEQYLDDWAQAEKGWLRKYYPADADEPHYDLTPATEKVIGWIAELRQRKLVSTESRLLTVFELLR